MTANGTTLIRAMRVMLAVFLAANFVFAVLTGFSGQLSALINVAAVIGLALVMRYQTKTIRRMDRQRLAQLRPRPDYSAIARMEEDIWGEIQARGSAGPARASNPNLGQCDYCDRPVYLGGQCLQCALVEPVAARRITSEYRDHVESLKGMAVTQSPETTHEGDAK